MNDTNAYDLPVGSVVAIPGRVFLKTASDVWQSTGTLNVTRSGWIEGLFSDGTAQLLRIGDGQ